MNEVLTDWKSEKNLSHYEIEQSNRMLILETLRALDNAGVENEYVNNFLNEKLEKTYKCLATSPEYAATLPITPDPTSVPNSEDTAVKEESVHQNTQNGNNAPLNAK